MSEDFQEKFGGRKEIGGLGRKNINLLPSYKIPALKRKWKLKSNWKKYEMT